MRLGYLVFIFLSMLISNITAQEISDFSLKNVDGKTISLREYKNVKGFIIVFTCNHCPFAQFYPDRLNRLYKKYKAKGIPLLAVNPMDTLVYAEENREEMRKVAERNSFLFPYLLDDNQKIAKKFKAKRTPEAFIIWKEKNSFFIKYQGAIDDNGAEPEKVVNHFLENALVELLSGKQVTEPETTSVGCKINYRK